MKSLIAMTTVGLLALGITLDAGAATPGVDARQHRQHHRIAHGVADGSLTYRETVRLSAQQHRVRRHEHRAKADGVVTRGERYRLHQHQNAASRNIYRQKHDGQSRD